MISRLSIWISLLFSALGVNGQGTTVQHEVVCFIYHRFGDHRYPSTNTSVKDFEDHLTYLRDHHYKVVTLSEAVKYVQSNDKQQKMAVITIDDGFTSFYKNGLPILKRFRMPATLFINTETVGGGDYMSWSQIRESMKAGLEIGNHTHTHRYFLNEPENTRYTLYREELTQCQEIIKKNLNITPAVTSYPYGEFDNEMKKIAKEHGFIASAAQSSGVFHENSDFFQIPRFPMSESYSPKNKFIEKATSKALRLKRIEPQSNTMPANKKPVLTLTLDESNLSLNRLQCFIQGGTCTFSFTDKDHNTIRVQPTAALGHRRRTICTVTVPDKNGAWHWYSHLWIDPNEHLEH